LCNNGYVLNDKHLIAEYAPDTFVFVISDNINCNIVWSVLQSVLPSKTLLVFKKTNKFDGRSKTIFRKAIGLDVAFAGVYFKGGAVYVPQCVVDKVYDLKPGLETKLLLEELIPFSSKNEWLLSRNSKNTPDFSYLSQALGELEVNPSNPMIICVLPIRKILKSCSDILAKRWMEVLGTPVIPFDHKERKKLEERASVELETYLRLNRA